MERKWSGAAIKSALASQRPEEIQEARNEMQKRAEEKEDQKLTEAIRVAIFVDDPDSLIKVEERKPMINALQQQQAKLQKQGEQFATELAALGGTPKVAENIAWLYKNLIRSLQILLQGRVDLISARGNQTKSVKSVRAQIYEQLEMSKALDQVKDYSLLYKAEWDGVAANLPTAEFTDAVLIDSKHDISALLEQQKNPAAVSKLALELGEAAAAKHDKLVLYVLGSEMMKHVFQKLVGDQSEELRAKLFDVLKSSYPENLALSYWPTISSDISDCRKLIKAELGELKGIANADQPTD